MKVEACQSAFTGVGVGPGDPGLITIRAADRILHADVVSYICSAPGRSQARDIAGGLLEEAPGHQEELPFVVPMNDDRTPANRIYDLAASDIQQRIDAGKRVVFLCEGDPLFFGSFAYLLIRLVHNRCEVVPGISSMHAASAALQRPLTLLDESFAVASGRHDLGQIVQTLDAHDSVVIMKAGRSRPRIIEALERAGRTEEAVYLEYIGRDNQRVETDVSRLPVEAGPYFSLFLVMRAGRAVK